MQESAPEDLELKRSLLADIDAATPEHVVDLVVDLGLRHDARCRSSARTRSAPWSGHPFNPPYLIPLVEVVGGEKTAADVVAWTSAFFRHAGKSVITMDREVPGFIANRLQEALWREALHMVADGRGDGRADRRCRSPTGPGLRWAFQGPMLTFHLAGGQGGMAHMLDHFGPSLLSPWTRLAAPELTPELRDARGATAATRRGRRRAASTTWCAERDRGARSPSCARSGRA